jgi:hypothetical protein
LENKAELFHFILRRKMIRIRNRVRKSDLKGKINRVPIEVVQKMCERQIEQGNKFDPSVFAENVRHSARKGGFDWYRTPEGHQFWETVVLFRNFTKFHNRYPKETFTERMFKFFKPAR